MVKKISILHQAVLQSTAQVNNTLWPLVMSCRINIIIVVAAGSILAIVNRDVLLFVCDSDTLLSADRSSHDPTATIIHSAVAARSGLGSIRACVLPTGK